MDNKKKSQELIIAASQAVKERKYWLDRMSGDLVKTGFPYDSPDKVGKEEKYRQWSFEFSDSVNTQLMKLSNNSDSRLHMILTAVLLVILHKYTGSNDIIVGTSIDKQEMEGNFINTVLALRNRVEEHMTLKELILQERDTVRQAMENRNYPIETLLYELNIPYHGGEFPLFDIAILLDNIHAKKYLDNIELNMTFCFSRIDRQVRGEVEYNALLYAETSMSQIVSRMEFILGNLFNYLEQPLSQIDMLTENERHQLLVEFNASRSGYPKEKTLHELFEEQVEKTPTDTALLFAGKQLTYTQLNEKSNRLSRLLRERGVNPETIVGLMVDISMEMVIGMIAILKAGGAFLPIDPDYPPDRIEYMMEDSQNPFILTREQYKSKVKYYSQVIDIDHKIDTGDGTNPGKISQSNHLAYVIYTSGSTGAPKGVMVQHQSIVNQIFGFNQLFYNDCLLNHVLLAPFTFDPSVQHVFSPLTYGAKLFLVPKTIKDDPLELMDFILQNNIDVFDAVPSQIDVLLDSPLDYSGVNFKYIILAGEVFSKNLYIKIREHLSVEKVVNIYGPTEATINTTMYECPRRESRPTIPIGKPLMNYQVYILGRNFRPVPIGVPGELYISGDGVARGYINQPELTAEKYPENPYIPGQRMYRSGDFARWLPDGNIDFVGRIDNQVKIRGQRIELAEVELQLQGHPAIKEAVVIAREDKNKIKYLSAYIVAKGDLDISRLREYLMEHLPDHMIPGHFVELEQMPLTPNGKVDRKALARIQMSGKSPGKYVAPQKKLEKELCQLWASELELEKVGIKDDYFYIGGDSIKSIKLINLINTRLGSNLKIADIYVHSTIEELAKTIENEMASPGKKPQKKMYNITDKHEDARRKIEELRRRVLNS